MTSSKIQITPSLLALRMTTARMTNHNDEWVPPYLMIFQRNPYLGESLLSYYVSEYFPTTPDYITAHAEVLGGPVLCPTLLLLTMSHPGGVECSGSTKMWVQHCNRYRVLDNQWISFRNNIIEHYRIQLIITN